MSASAEELRANRLQTVREALDGGAVRRVGQMLHSLHPAELGLLLESLPPTERNIVWQLVGQDAGGEVLLEVNDEVRAGLIDGMDPEALVHATGDMEVDDLADLFEDLPETVIPQVLRAMDVQDRERLESVLAYPEDSAGGLMNTDTVTVRPDVTLDVVLRYLRLRGNLPEGTDILFVVNRYGQYLGSLGLTDLLVQDPQATVAELMDTGIDGIDAETSASEVAKRFEDRDLVSAPVVDADNRLLGRITVDDVLDVIREEAEHSIMSMAGLDEDDDIFAPVVTSARRRAVWLGVNLATAFLAAGVVGMFEATIDKIVALAVLMPVVASMGGIAGGQTLTLMIRGLALGQVERSNARLMMSKEIAVGILNGLIWALVVALIVMLWFQSWQIGAVIALAISINLFVAAISGVAIPLLLRSLGVDPALAGNVILTTVTDVVGFFVFLGLGALLLV